MNVLILLLLAAALLCSCGTAATPSPAPSPVAVASPVAPPPAPAQPPAPPAPPDARPLVRQGTDLVLARRYREAVPVLEKARKIDPGNPEVHLWLFNAHKGLELLPIKGSPAYKDATQVVKLMPGTPQAANAQDYLASADVIGKVPSRRPVQDVTGFEKGNWESTGREIRLAYRGDLVEETTDVYSHNPDPRVFDHMLTHQSSLNFDNYQDQIITRERMIAGHPYRAAFAFRSAYADRLVGVYISPDPNDKGRDLRMEFHTLTGELARMYGAPTRRSDQGKRRRWVWEFPSSVVFLSLYDDKTLILAYENSKTPLILFDQP